MTKEIPLNQGQIALVDDEDYERVKKWSLYAHKKKNGRWYIRVIIRGKKFMLHRLLLDAPKGIDVDHINGNGLDNRKCNLRLATKSQNQMNRIKINTRNGNPCTSIYKGVSWHAQINKWIVHIKINGKITHLGSFSSEIEAAKTYNEAAKKYFGEYARLNEIKD